MGYLYIGGAVFFTVYGNIVLKWQVDKAGEVPVELSGKISFLLQLLPNPWILSCFAAGFAVFSCWAMAMTKFDLSYAYPFMSLSFVFVPLLSALLFKEPLTVPNMIGIALIISGVIVGNRF